MAERQFFRFLPPAGDPIPFNDILRAALDSSLGDGGQFAAILRSYLATNHCYLVSSGTAALHLILRAISDETERNEVVIPAYCCPSLVASTVKAGLKVRLCDIRRNGFGFDLERLGELLNPRTLCVVVVHLFGIPHDMKPIMDMVTRAGAITVEDSAQAFGVSPDAAKLGTIGDIGFYSFGRGKPLTMLGGAAIVTNRTDCAEKIEKYLAELPKNPLFVNVSSLAKVTLYSLFVHPYLYWIPNSLPFLRLGETKFVSQFETRSMCRYQAALGKILVFLSDSLNQGRARNSRFLIERLTHCTDNPSFFIPGDDFPIPYLRLPVILVSPNLRERILSELVGKGIGATRMYGVALPRIAGVSPHLFEVAEYPNAEYIAARLLTLPVNSLVTQKDVETVIGVFENVSESGKNG